MFSFLFSPYMPHDLPISSSLMWLPITSYFIGPNIFVGTLFWNTLNLFSSPHVRDHVSYPHETGGRIILLYVLILKRCVGWNQKETVQLDSPPRSPTKRLLSCEQVTLLSGRYVQMFWRNRLPLLLFHPEDWRLPLLHS
jgi:hypothetical protein